ncbi:MAG: coproporphyrinogen dehydrogenase HemZ [Tissierellia bacterium]|nr:coproporphyrinogen dehydrogenase HemZ [Tissierellia bacterium]
MKINLKYEKYKKDIIDICRIFPMPDPEFISLGEVLVERDKILLDRTYHFESRLELKQILYDYLSEKYNYRSPWGLVTGTKPQKLYDKYEGLAKIDALEKDYRLSREKLLLLEDIHRALKNINFDPNNIHLYINIPFCPSRCSYCSFPTIIYKNKDRREEYIKALIEEILALKDSINKRRLRSIYVGGGTPSALTLEQMEKLLSCLDDSFKLENLEEFTFEAGREDTLDKEKLALLKNYKVSRLSLNPQSFNSKTLDKVGRNFDGRHFEKMYVLAKKLGFVVNMDLILGLEDEGLEELELTMDMIERYKPDNLTIHTLSIKRGSKISQDLAKSDNKSKGVEDLVDYSQKKSKDLSYKPYYLYRQKEILGNFENIGYFLSDKYSIYNVATNEERESILGVGMTANSKILVADKLIKYTNYKNIDEYIANLNLEIDKKKTLLDKKIKEVLFY